MLLQLKEKAINGAVWTSIHKLASLLLGFISGIILARLLTPHDYGVIGMLSIFLAVSSTFIDGGFGSALIQKKRPTDTDYSTIFYWNMAFSAFLYWVLFLCAPYIARFYNLPLLSDVLRVQGLILMINAARIVQRNQLRKRLEFKKITIINLTAHVVALGVTIYLAGEGWGVWALVVQQLLVGVLTSGLYWITSTWKPILVFSLQSFKELFSFGGFVLLANLINTICNNIQGLLIGKVYNSSTLGYYSKARRIEGLSSTFISNVLNQVTYPVFSEVQDEKQRLILVLRKIICTSAFVTFPLLLLMILIAKPLFLLLYSERWLPSVPYFRLLCLAGIAICLQNVNYYAIAAIGKSKDLFNWTLVKRGIGLMFVIGGLWLYGIYGLLIGSIVTSWVIYIINAKLVSQHIGYTLMHQFRDLLPIIVLSIIAFLTAYFITLIWPIGLYMDGIIEFTIFVTIYLLSSVIWHLNAYEEAKETILVVINRIGSKSI